MDSDSDSDFDSYLAANQGNEYKNRKITWSPDQEVRQLAPLAPVRAWDPNVDLKANPPSGPAMARLGQIASNIHWPDSDDDLRTRMEGTDEKLPMGSTRYDPDMDDDQTLLDILGDFTENARELFDIDVNPASYDSRLPRYHIAPTEEAIMLRGVMPGLSVSLFDECSKDKNIQRSAGYSTTTRYRTIDWREELKAFTPYMLVDESGTNRIFCLAPSIYVDRTDRDHIITSELGMEIYEVEKVSVKDFYGKRTERLECRLLGEVITHTKKTYADLCKVFSENFGTDPLSLVTVNLYEINVNYHAQRVLSDIPSLVFKLGPKSLLKADNALANVMGFVFGENEGRINTQRYLREKGQAQLDSSGPRLYNWQIEQNLRKEQWLIDVKKSNAEKKLKRERGEENVSEDEDENWGGKKRKTRKHRTKTYKTKSRRTRTYKKKSCRTKKCRTKSHKTKSHKTKSHKTKK
jgi:hypothetical protein